MHLNTIADTCLPRAPLGAPPCSLTPMPIICHHAFLDRIDGDTSGVFVVSSDGVWHIEVIVSDEIRTLTDGTSTIVHTFASLNDASDFLHAVDIHDFSVIRESSATDVADYDNWVLEAIQDALREADDPATEWISNDEVEATAKALRGEDGK